MSDDRLRFLLLALVSQGHVFLEDSPGVGKTLTAKTLAQSIDSKCARIQCTPDLLPSDITGTSIYNMSDSQFEFRPGPVFFNILLADEVNRTGPRTQLALLEAMAEGQVSADARCTASPIRSWSSRLRTPWKATVLFHCRTLSRTRCHRYSAVFTAAATSTPKTRLIAG